MVSPQELQVWDVISNMQIGPNLTCFDNFHLAMFQNDNRGIISETENDYDVLFEWPPLQKLIDKTSELVRNRLFTEDEKKKYYLFGENPAEDQDFEEQGSPLGSWKVDHANKSDEAKEIIYSLVADIGNHPYYNTYKCAERIFRFCQSMLSFTDLENPDMKKQEREQILELYIMGIISKDQMKEKLNQ